MEEQEELINGAEFARRLGVDRTAPSRWVREGKLEIAKRETEGLAKPVTLYRASDVERLRKAARESSQTDIV